MKESILFIEDDLVEQMQIKRMFKMQEKFSFDVAASVAGARQFLSEKKYSIIVTDYFLGDGTGLDIIVEVKNTPIIFTTGNEAIEAAIEAMKSGASDYLIKDIEGNYLKTLPVIIGKILKNEAALKRLKQAEKERAEAVLAKEQYLSILSHEIRNPLNSLLGFVSIMKNKDPKKEQLELLKQMSLTGDHLLGLINDMLDYSRVNTDKFQLDPQPISMIEFADMVENSASAILRESKVAFSLELKPEVPALLTSDKTKLLQICHNLIGNAIKFTSEGKITCTFGYFNNQLIIHVSDTGIGIENEKLKDVFEPFTQANNSISTIYKGTGLGLAVVKKIVESMKGKISLKSAPGKGTTFEITLPVEANDCNAEVYNDAVINALYVEDASHNQLLMQHYFDDWGWNLCQVTTVDQAIDTIQNTVFDIVLLDMELANEKGIELIHRLAGTGYLAQTSFLLVTGMDEGELPEDSLQNVLMGIIYKPFDAHKLKAEIRRIVSNRRNSESTININK